jgi:DNA mismatch repair ATPase MutS
VFTRINDFAAQMREMRANLARVDKMHYLEQKQAWFLDAVENYCHSIKSFAADLLNADLKSRGLIGFRDYLTSYVASAPFISLVYETEKLKANLATIRYSILIKGSSFTVRKYDSEIDYSADVEETFKKFKQGAPKDYRVKFSASEDMNHVEAKILEFVAKLHPEIFVPLTEFCTRHADYLDPTVAEFDREVQFYTAYLDYTAPLKRHGLLFCYPRISEKHKEVCDYDGFDIALAHKLTQGKLPVVPNDFHLKGRERILVVSGPNQGGKTTFARAFGQLHYLGSIGCPVPGGGAQLFLFDQLFTHFEREEKVENLRGKLEDDLVRIHHILERASPRSILVMNEVFTSTTLQDEIFLSTKIMQRVVALDLLCVWVTFLDELASSGPQTVSMVSTVVPENPALRTFKILRRPADGLAYAMAIAQKHRLTYDAIQERIRS